jgi:hypothetical protein
MPRYIGKGREAKEKEAAQAERARLAALKSNDMTAYSKLLEETKNDRLKFLKWTRRKTRSSKSPRSCTRGVGVRLGRRPARGKVRRNHRTTKRLIFKRSKRVNQVFWSVATSKSTNWVGCNGWCPLTATISTVFLPTRW